MTAFTTLLNALFIPGKPILGSTGSALRDNPLAMFEGDASAPRLQFGALDGAFSAAGGLGSYVFARRNVTGDQAFGATVAGSTLLPISAVASISFPANSGTYPLPTGAALTGTWRCMGNYSHTGYTAPTLGGATLWMRIA